MPPVLIALLIALGLVSVLGFFVNPWATAMAIGIGLAVLLAAAIAWRTEVYLNRPSRRR
jgi:FtsH-binding integral membrane protein